MPQGITKGDALQRLAGVSLIGGSILLIIGNLLFPRSGDVTKMDQFVRAIADTNGGRWEVVHLLLALGFWGVMVGAAGVYRSIASGGAAAWARLGFYGVIVGTTVWTLHLAIQGFGLNLLVAEWEKAASGADKATLLQVATSTSWLTAGTFSMAIIVLWLALLFLGIGMALSPVYPKWLGWVIIILGAATVVLVGLPQALAGPSQLVTIVLFTALSLLSTLWALVLGVWIARKAW